MISTLILMTYLSFPSLSLAIGMQESGLNRFVDGDKGQSKGLFHVQAKHWGKVSKHLPAQMNQHDTILLELLASCGEPMDAIARYNGSGKAARKYAKKIRKSAFEISLLEVL